MGNINILFFAKDEAVTANIMLIAEVDGICVDKVNSEKELFETLSAIQYSIVIIDVGEAEQFNLDLIVSLRKQTSLGIIVVTADTLPVKRIESYESGADQFFTAPLENLELTAAVRNLHNRLQISPQFTEATPNDSSSETYWVLNKSSWCLISPDDTEVKLTAKEIKFLELVMLQVGENVLRESFRKYLGYSSNEYGSRSIDSMVRRLRKKVFTQLSTQLPLQTVHAVGYCFSASAKVLGNPIRS